MYPEPENQIIKNDQWKPLHIAIEHLLIQLTQAQRETFCVKFKLEGYGIEPYLQGYLDENGDFIIEFSSNVFLEPNLTAAQRAQLDGLGWSKPNGKNPNYSKRILRAHPVAMTSRYLVTTLRVVLELPIGTWMDFGTSKEDLEVSSSDMFWHRLVANNEVCLPNQNTTETREGIS